MCSCPLTQHMYLIYIVITIDKQAWKSFSELWPRNNIWKNSLRNKKCKFSKTEFENKEHPGELTDKGDHEKTSIY